MITPRNPIGNSSLWARQWMDWMFGKFHLSLEIILVLLTMRTISGNADQMFP